MKSPTDAQLAHALARFGLGINLALHGLTRIPKFAEFAAHLQTQFAPTILPSPLVSASAYGIVTAECVVGVLLLLGWKLRATLVGGSLLMCILLFGTCLVQNWTVAGDQLVYLAFFAALLATRRYDWFSVDAVTRDDSRSPTTV
jgi:thiosulfate dehydrogenase [quinone] large subunit